MSEFQSKRASYHYRQTNEAAPERVFPLLCPVREAEWAPGWQYRMIYSASGIAESGCVFATPAEDGSEITWVVAEYDPRAGRIAFVWTWPQKVATGISIVLSAAGAGRTHADIGYTYTGLSEAGNELVARRYSAERFAAMMTDWERAINAYLAEHTPVTRK